MTTGDWLTASLVLVTCLSFIVAAVALRLASKAQTTEHSDALSQEELQRRTEELQRYANLQKDLEMARGELGTVRSRLVAAEAKAQEQEREIDRLSRRIVRLTDDVERNRIAQAGTP